ncbi:MAG TPA: heparan-alpha-glucosaminide N-acetyltransferase domain-containing protein [Vicinamibacteria bacterium]|nr:heparan-alpha-glucosaminide N-acetyltransferase domain-containing protein [Vicinamibacteria bacterium]
MPTRLVSLDAFRGLTIAAMMLVNNPGSWSAVYWPLDHAHWHGWTPTDLVFPFFLFIVGMALPFSRRIGAGQALRRAAILFGLGLFMAAYPRFDLSTVRIPGVLPRIALCYFAAWAVRRAVGVRGQAAVAGALCLLYWILMTRVPVPGVGPASLEPDLNLGAWLDRLLLSGHLWKQSRTWDPEGLLGTLPAIATTLLGCVAGSWVRSERSPGDKAAGLLGAGVLLTLAGLAWGLWFPINKSLWTSSYVLFTAGMAAYVFGLVYWVADVRGHAAWARPFVAYGRNAILVFVASGLLLKTLILIKVPGPEGTSLSLQAYVYRALFGSWLPPYPASLAHALAHVVGWGALCWVLDRRRVYLTI